MVLSAQEVYEQISSCDKDNLQNAVNSILKKLNKGYKGENRTLLVDATPGDVDVNFRSKRITKKSLEHKDYKWAWGTALGNYLGFKLLLFLIMILKCLFYSCWLVNHLMILIWFQKF